MTHYFIGCDPGVKGGAIAVLDQNGRPVRVFKIPTRSHGTDKWFCSEIDTFGLEAELGGIGILKCNDDEIAVFVEQPWGGGHRGALMLLQSTGVIVGVLEMVCRVKVRMVYPASWQSFYGLIKARGVKETNAAKKERSLVMARARFPEIDLRQKQHNNMAEALLIAEWGRLNSAQSIQEASCVS